MAIGNNDFTAKEKAGFAYGLNCANDWPTIEPLLLNYMKTIGELWRLEKNEKDSNLSDDMASIRNILKDDPTKILSVKTLLGISVK
jgi:hypothetical protein